METGTGKMLVYLRTVYELCRNYGFTKFIILVPSVPIREGVLGTIESCHPQLERLYNIPQRAFEYDSKKLTKMKRFIEGTDLQVMIMTTHSFSADDNIINRNAGIDLPPRRAETILFDPPAEDVETITRWEDQLRQSLSTLVGGQASMQGRVILQAAGSSHAAWSAATRDWKPAKDDEAAKVFERLFLRKLEPLPQLAKDAGGLVLFTQFLATQAAVADALEARGVGTWTIHGGTPAAERQPITEKFRREGGVLLLSRSGTEGRNLQFCHRLVNFDLPWNPMEIEQRIGRLHRIGQKHPVEIYNLVTAGTLQARLLDLLQEKLNLFELVVGETGLILGERFASDDLGEEIFRCWQGAEDGDVESAFLRFARELEAARANYNQIRELDETLFGEDYETG